MLRIVGLLIGRGVKGENHGLEGSSEAVAQPPGASVAGASRTVFLSYASPDAKLESDEANRLDILPMVLHAAGHQVEADQELKTLTSKFADSDAYYVA